MMSQVVHNLTLPTRMEMKINLVNEDDGWLG